MAVGPPRNIEAANAKRRTEMPGPVMLLFLRLNPVMVIAMVSIFVIGQQLVVYSNSLSTTPPSMMVLHIAKAIE